MSIFCFLPPDDLDVSVDFFEYFLSLYPVLRDDPSLWCVSAWNDNGKENRISQDAGKGWSVGRSIKTPETTQFCRAFNSLNVAGFDLAISKFAWRCGQESNQRIII